MTEPVDINVTELESRVVQTIQVLLTIAAIALNIVYLIFVKANSQRLNATEVLQMSKTAIVLLALAICMPLDSIVVSGVRRDNIRICLLKDWMDKLLMGAYPFAIMAVAITRFRVCMCMGNATVLVTRTSAFVTLGLCLLLPFMSATTMVVLYFINDVYKSDNAREEQADVLLFECRSWSNSAVETYRDVLLVALGVSPVVLTILIYAAIFYRVSGASNRSTIIAPMPDRIASLVHRCSQFRIRRDVHDSNMKTTMCLLLSVFTIPWCVCLCFAVIESLYPDKVASFCLILSKPIIYLIHPVAEGLFLKHKRNKLIMMFQAAFCRQKQFPQHNLESFGQNNSSSVKNHTVSEMLTAVNNIDGISTTPLRSSTKLSLSITLDNDVDCKDDLYSEGLYSQPILYTRRTGRLFPPILAIVDGNEPSDDIGVCSITPAHSPFGETLLRPGGCTVEGDMISSCNSSSVHTSTRNGIHVSPHNGIHLSQRNRVHVSPRNKIHVSRSNGVHVSQRNGIQVSPHNGIHVSSRSGIHTSPRNGIHTSPSNGIHVSPRKGIVKENTSSGRKRSKSKVKSCLRISESVTPLSAVPLLSDDQCSCGGLSPPAVNTETSAGVTSHLNRKQANGSTSIGTSKGAVRFMFPPSPQENCGDVEMFSGVTNRRTSRTAHCTQRQTDLSTHF